MSTTSTADAAGTEPAEDLSGLATYHHMARLIERLHRRFVDIVRIELIRVGIDDISPVQALMLMLIGDDELSVRDLLERGYYLSSNASYNLKGLVDGGYVARSASQRDRRAARLRLSDRGRKLRDELARVERRHAETLARNADEIEDLDAAYRTLRRLERIWGDHVRYSSNGID